VILATAEDESSQRLASTNLPFRRAITNRCPVFEDAYLVYEAELARPQRDFAGNAIFEAPWVDVGSHRIYFLEINAIQLRADIAQGNSQVRWHSLPRWQPVREVKRNPQGTAVPATVPYQKGFRSDYAFPSANTVAFEANGIEGGRAFKLLPRVAQEQVELDNDRARWPCFFPSSVGMITCQADGGDVNLMPCGSTTVLSRQPMVIAPAVSYAAINQRYAPRASLELIRKAGRFGCGVPMANQQVLNGICYAGNVSFAADSRKVTNAGFTIDRAAPTPRLAELPVHYDCELTGEIRLGTHFLFLGEVRRISVRADVTPGNPICWIPWANVEPVPAKECA
jgi:flavin reductase (DIM6/NTAB) family NADH-FMN oxidoreductase RutF